MPIFKIPEANVSRLEAHMEGLTKICHRLKVDAPTVELIKIEQIEKMSPAGHKYISVYHHFNIEGIDPKLNGWVFKSKREKMEDGDLISSTPGFDLPEKYRKRETCDHCNTMRSRNRYFFVERAETQEFKQVGSTCIKDFLGHKSPETVAAWFEFINSIVNFQDEDDYSGSGGRAPVLYFFKEALKVIHDRIQSHGFYSRKAAQESGDDDAYVKTTSHVCSSLLDDMHWPPPKMINPPKLPVITAEDEAMIKDFIKFWEDRKDTSDFTYNVQETLKVELGIRPRKMGILCAAVNIWYKETQEQVERKVYPASTHFGDIGEKVKLEVTFIRTAAFDGMYGTTFLHNFRDAEGHIFVWSTSKELPEGPDECVIKGTVKEHRQWKDQAQTFLTRCKIEEIAK